MDEHLKNEKFNEYTVLSAIIAVILVILSLFVALTASSKADFSLEGIAWIYKHDAAMWLIIVAATLLPLAVWWVSRKYDTIVTHKQKIIDNENERIAQVNNFTQQLIHDNLDVDFQLKGDNDILGETLINLRNTLKTNQENGQKLRKAEEQRNWIAEGLAHFSETLRNYIHEPDQLSFQVIKDLTKYVNAIQGGFYLLDDSDPHNRFFKLASFFAYDRRKFANQIIKWGDGLIGTSALEKKTINLKHIPESYITVTSGLGEANPDNLIVVPMIYEDQIFGVLELASFTKYDSDHIALIEKTAESVAATLSAIKTNLRTAQLLEESKAQTQALTSHEEEMRQNMEELQATQEEAMRQSQRLVMLEDNLKQNILQAEFDSEGRLISANSLFYSKFEYNNDLKIEGKHISEFVEEENRDGIRKMWANLMMEAKPYKGYIKNMTRTGKDLWVMTSLSISRHEDKSFDRVMFLGVDVTEERNEQQKKEAIVQSVNITGINIELDINGNLLECNEAFVNLFKLSQKEVKSTVIFDVIHPIELEAFNKKWDSIINGNSFSGVIRGKTTKGDEVWLNGSFNSTRNSAHETDHVVFVGIDVTHEKQIEKELSAAHETLKRQDRQIKDSEKELGNKLRETKSEMLAQFKEIEKIKNLNERMLEETTDAIITTSHDNRIVFFNKAAEDLWQINRTEILNHDIGILFPESVVEKDELLGSFIRPGDHKITGKRKKSTIIDKKGKEKPVLVLLTKARVDNENSYMAIIQIADK